jgi:hypothetical protein
MLKNNFKDFKNLSPSNDGYIVFSTTTEATEEICDNFYVLNGVTISPVSRNYIIKQKIVEEMTQHLSDSILSESDKSFCDRIYETLMSYRDE